MGADDPLPDRPSLVVSRREPGLQLALGDWMVRAVPRVDPPRRGAQHGKLADGYLLKLSTLAGSAPFGSRTGSTIASLCKAQGRIEAE